MHKYALIPLVFILISFQIIFGQAPSGYYDAAAGKSGAQLKSALFNIIKNHNDRGYTYVWTAFGTTDRKANGNMWDPYSAIEWTYGSQQCGNYSGEGSCYNREHSFPKSWFNDASPMHNDLFHLYPTDGYVNGVRGNLVFGEVGTANYTSTNGCRRGNNTFPGYSGTVFEPADEYKGDFARTYFYMATRYEDKIALWENNDNDADAALDGSSYPAYEPWYLNLMAKWHNQDPVSTKEVNRNNAIYAIQGNRNPYIDHPEYAGLVWNFSTSGVNTIPGTNTSSPGSNLTIPGLLYYTDFGGCAGDWSIRSVSGSKNWYCHSNGYYEANGFISSTSTAPGSETWLVRGFVTSTTGSLGVSFTSYTKFTDNVQPHPQLALLYSTDYNGISSPGSATWYTVSGLTFATSNSQINTRSGTATVSGLPVGQVHFAFRYRSSGSSSSGAALWRVEDFTLSLINGTVSSPPIVVTTPGVNTLLGSSQVTTVVSEGFATCGSLSQWYIRSVSGTASQQWTCTGSGYMQANAFVSASSTAAGSESWLLTPEVNTTNTGIVLMSFSSYATFTDNSLSHPQMSVYMKTAYDPLTPPSTSTWTLVSGFAFPSANSSAWVSSGEKTITGLPIAQQLRFAFRYASSGAGASSSTRWRLDQVVLKSVSTTLPGVVPTTPGVTNRSPTAQNVTFAGNSTLLSGLSLAAYVSDPDGDALRFTPLIQEETPLEGRLQLSEDGILSYSNPLLSTSGVDKYFYEVCDLSNACTTAALDIAITITSTGISTTPGTGSTVTGPNPGLVITAKDTVFSLHNKQTLLATLSGMHNLTTQVALSFAPYQGTLLQGGFLLIRTDGSIRYLPNSGAAYTEQLVFTVCGLQVCDTAVVKFVVSSLEIVPTPTVLGTSRYLDLPWRLSYGQGNIYLMGAPQAHTLSIWDMQGKIYLHRPNPTYPLPYAPAPGMYMLVATTDKEVLVTKIWVE